LGMKYTVGSTASLEITPETTRGCEMWGVKIVTIEFQNAITVAEPQNGQYNDQLPLLGRVGKRRDRPWTAGLGLLDVVFALLEARRREHPVGLVFVVKQHDRVGHFAKQAGVGGIGTDHEHRAAGGNDAPEL